MVIGKEVRLAKEAKGRPKEIDTWREIQYLDLERRRLHIPLGSITWEMLSDDVKHLLSLLPTGYYSGDGSTFVVGLDEVGRVLFNPVIYGGSRYGMCVYGADVAIYGIAKYDQATYGKHTASLGAYGAGGYGSMRYG